MEDSTNYDMAEFARIVILCEANPTVLLKNLAFKNAYTKIKAMKGEADALGVKLEWKSNGITVVSASVRKEVAFTFSPACLSISSYGEYIEDGALIDMKRYTDSYLMNLPKDEVITALANILEVVNLNKIPLTEYGFTTSFIATLTNLQTKFIGKSSLTKETIQTHKVNKGLLNKLIIEMKALQKSQLDKTVGMFKFEDVEFYDHYVVARRVDHHHIHNKAPLPPDSLTGCMALKIFDKATGQGVTEATLSVILINYIAVTDINGEIENDKLLPGVYTATLTKVGYATIEFTFTIIKAEITEIGFMMEAEAIA